MPRTGILTAIAILLLAGGCADRQCVQIDFSYAGQARGPLRYNYAWASGGSSAGGFVSLDDARNHPVEACRDPTTATTLLAEAWIDVDGSDTSACPGTGDTCIPDGSEPAGRTSVGLSATDEDRTIVVVLVDR